MPVCHKLIGPSVVALVKYIHVFYRLYSYYFTVQINSECLRHRKYKVFTVVSLERRPKKSD